MSMFGLPPAVNIAPAQPPGFGGVANASEAMAAVANDGHYFNVQKAREELALPQTSIGQAVAEAFDWFKTNHYV